MPDGFMICIRSMILVCETYTQVDKQIQKKRRSAISTGENHGKD